MRTIIITIAMIIASASSVFSQIRFDVIAGISPGSAPASAGLIVNRHLPHEEFVFNMNKVDPQFYAGVKGYVELAAPFYMEAGLTYTKRKSTYDIVYTIVDREHPVSNHLMSETEHMIMLPVNIGVNLGAFDVTSGLRLIQSIKSDTDLDQLTGFSAESKPIRIGWQASAGFSFLRERIGLEYQGNFSRVGSGMYVNGQSMELMNVPGQLVLTLQHSF